MPLAILTALPLDTCSLGRTWVFILNIGIGSTLPVLASYFEHSRLALGPIGENGSYRKYGLMSFNGTPPEDSKILLKKGKREQEGGRELGDCMLVL